MVSRNVQTDGVVQRLLVMSTVLWLCHSETLYFQPTNVDNPSLYQSMQLRFTGWSALSGDPTMRTGDFMYIVGVSTTSCAATAPSSTNNFPVTVDGSQSFATATLVVAPSNFVVGNGYAACYVSTQTGLGYVTKRSQVVNDVVVETSFIVLSSIYASSIVTPSTVYAGQGLIAVSITESDERANGRSLNQGGVGGLRPYFLACTPNCGDYATLAGSCGITSGVTFASIDGYATTTLQGTFTAPQQPSSGGYAICVPYCYSATAGCAQASYPMSWAVVTAAALIVQPANPSAYIVAPANPTVRMSSTMNFTGTGLAASDRIKIIEAGGSCSSSSAALLGNVNYNQAVTLLNSTGTSAAFVSLNLITSSIVGQVCYARGGGSIFAPVFQQSSATSDFVVLPMQPANYSTVPTSPSLGQSFTATFRGTSLDATQDVAFFVTSSSSTCVVSSSSDLCDGTTLNPTYACTLSGGATPTCTITADPETNSATTLCACYKIGRSNNYAMVSGSILLTARNPVYSLSPYPVYAGQAATLLFSGSGISAADTVAFVPSTSTCDGTPVTNVSAYNPSSNSSTASAFTISGPGMLCLRVCYKFQGSTTWVISRPSSPITIDASCAATLLYVSPFSMRYALSPTNPTARATIAATLSGSAQTAVAMVVVPANESCVLVSCGSGSVCAQAALSADYFSPITSSSALFAITRTSSQVLCISLGSTFIPVLSSGATYTFNSGDQNPSAYVASPTTWRVSMSDLNATFVGTQLNATTDIVRALAVDSLLSNKGVCPREASIVTTVLTATAFAGASTTATTFAFQGADTLAAQSSVHVCYYRGVAGSRIASYVGFVSVLPQNPANMTTAGALRAGEVVALTFVAATSSSVSPAADALTFYQFQASAIAPTCRCDAASCSSAISTTKTSIPLTGSSSSSVWRNPLGFDNLASNAIFVVCYTVSGSGSPTYTGQITVAQSHPSYYTLGSTAFRVGLPVTVTVSTLCSTCASLNASDDIILVLNASNCADVSGMSAAEAQAATAVQYNDPSTLRSLVPLVEGHFRVCYKKSGSTSYQELTFSSQFLRTPIAVGPADPGAFAPVPATPTAGQYLIVNLTSCSATVCSNCAAVRLVRGTATTCWNTSLPSYTSSSCVGSATLYQFPNQFLPAGAYTVCFGDTVISRVPGTLTIAAANPSTFTAPSASIFTNQGSRATLTLTGSGLSSSDSIFVLPNVSAYSCHDLRDSQINIRLNATYAGWWSPSTSPYQIAATGPAATWVASDSLNRFSAEIIASNVFCSNVGVSCALQVCYLRQGTSWAPVPMSGGAAITLLPANPQTVTFDVSGALRVTQYVLATVTGTALTASDTLYFSDGLCELLNIVASTVSVSTVSGDARTWRGVLRFVGRNSGTVRGCYVSGQTTTEIPNIPSIASIQGQLYYLKQSTWNEAQTAGAQSHALTQYESVYIAGTTSAVGASQIPNVASMYLVRSADECNYEPYRPNAYELQANLSRVDGQTSYFLGRLYRQGTFALCLNTSGLLFRIVASVVDNSATSIVVLSPNPASYVLSPITPFAGQFFSISLQFNTSLLTFERQNVTGDMLRLISGGLESCGFLNATTVVNLTLTAEGTATTSLPAATSGSNHTLCYRTYNGSFATVPRFSLADRNVAIAAAYPLYFSTSPVIPQATVSMSLTFYSNNTGPLSTSDGAYLVRITNTSRLVPLAADCTQAPVLSTATMGGITSNTSVWSISAAAGLTPGNYTVCYVVAANGKGAAVPNPGFLVVVERQSPYSVETDSVGGLSIYSGERIRLFFLSNVSLSPSLSWESSAASDQVVFSTSGTCASPIDRTQVASIPASFGYSAPTKSESFLHMRFRTTGTFYVCMKRTGRQPNQQYYTFDAVGGPDLPLRLTVLAAPIQSILLQPVVPRVAVPDAVVVPTFASGITAASLQQLFASAYANSTISDSITEDSCYYPPSNEASAGAVLVNTTLGFGNSNLTAVHPFPAPGRYVVCYSMPLRTIASLPVPFTVAAMSPIYYVVPDLIAPGTSFAMTLRSTDSIFASVTNVATVVPYNGVVSCRGSITAATGTSNFTSFTGNATVSAVQPLLPQQGSYFVCFKAYDQREYFAVPNVVGGFLFGVGNVGPTSYSVDPTPRYAGQRLTLSIVGNMLRGADTAKVVNVTSVSATEYFTICSNASTADANALNPSGASGAGINVSFVSTVAVSLSVRVISRGTFILCYRGATNAWAYVPDVATFAVGAPFPSAYITSPAVPYATQSIELSIRHDAGGLSTGDGLKLVQRGSASDGFDCTEDATAFLLYSNISSSATVRNVSICTAVASSVTVCYKVAGGTWAEVPYFTGRYQALSVAANPLDIGSLQVSRTPRPLETVAITLSTTVTGLTIQRAVFVPYTASTCNTTTTPIVPLFVSASGLTISTAIAASGAYTVMVGLSASGPLITIPTPLVIAPCDPCTFAPVIMFTEATYATTFASTSNSFNTSDTVRIVPASTPLSTPSLCSTAGGAFGATIFATTAATSSMSSFAVATPAGSSGSYYVCYRKNTSTDFAVVASSLGSPVVLQIVVPQPSAIASTCPSQLYGGQGTTLLLQSASPTLVPLMSSDTAFLVPSSSTCDATAGRTSMALYGAAGSNASFDVVLPSLPTTQSFRLCYVHTLDARSRSVAVFAVNARDPITFFTAPTNVSVGLTNVNISFNGAALSASDDVLFVSNVTSCMEYCRERPLALSTVSPPFTVEASQLPTTFVVQLNGSFSTTGSLRVCYRRAGGTLAQLPSPLVVAAANPSSYTTNFVPRQRTRPTLNFTGTQLSESDAVKMVPLGAVCSSSAAIVTGSFVAAAPTHLWATFFVPLADPVAAAMYTICYNLGGVGWIPVAPTFQVLAGGPTFLTTTNVPMAGRAFTLSFDEQNFTDRYGLGDNVQITCGTCSCWEDGPASVAYGAATSTVTTLTTPTALRVGFQLSGTSYVVCYRLADSGFGLVASMAIATPSPALSQLLPTPSAFRGQRLNVSVFGGDQSRQYSVADQIMLASPVRGCWDPATSINSDVYAFSNVTQPSAAIGTTEAHIPSLGPSATASLLTFPLNTTVCFREHGQPEFLHVPFPQRTVYPIQPADPKMITTVPSVVREGMINVTVAFVTTVLSADLAVAVIGQWGDRICDSPSSVRITNNQNPVGFIFTALHPNGVPLQNANVTLCYTRSGGSIAEVPQQIAVAPRNPFSFTINTTSPRNREYVLLSVFGTDLSPTNTQLRIVAVPCAEGASTVAAVATSRFGSIGGSGTQINVTVQLMYPSAAFTAYVCAFYGGAWSQLGSFAVMDAAPQLLTAAPTRPRVGQHVVLTFSSVGTYNASRAAVLLTTGDQSWCHNYSVPLDPSVTLSGPTEVSSEIWTASGTVRVCLMKDSGLWTDVDDSRYNVSSIVVLPPNPASLWTYPRIARVGQRVVLSLAVTEASFQDLIILADAQDPSLATVACDAPSMQALDRLTPTRLNTSTVEVLLNDTSDILMYRSFGAPAIWRVCYYSDAERAWSVVGGTVSASTWSVLVQSPFMWYQASGKLVAKKAAVIGFVGVVSTLATTNDAWFVPMGTSCAVRVCDECMDLPLDPATLNATSIRTQPFVARLDGNYSICYTLTDATAAMVPGTLSIATSDIQCVVQETVRIGRRQELILRKLANVNTTSDTMQFSIYGSTTGVCNATLLPEFPAARAQRVAETATTVTYSLEWPVTMNNIRYTLCYFHEGESSSVCACSQFDSRSAECFLTTEAPMPSSFDASPKPSYVGQSITLTIRRDAASAPDSVALVPYTSNNMSTCRSAAATSAILSSSTVHLNSTTTLFRFKHNYSTGANTFIVCAQLQGMVDLVRLPTSMNALQVLTIRPYVALATRPQNPMLYRASSTIQLTISHTSTMADDLLTSMDAFTFVRSPYLCNESHIDGNATHSSVFLAAVSLSDSTLLGSTSVMHLTDGIVSTTYITFNSLAVGGAPWYMCFLLRGATWSVVDHPMTILPAVFDQCIATTHPSVQNNDAGTLRAMQYIPVRINGSASDFTALQTTLDDIRVVPASYPCFNESFSIFVSSKPFLFSSTLLTTVIWSSVAGNVKVCYRFGGASTSLFSPVCTIPLSDTAPTATTVSGCKLAGQTLTMTATYTGSLAPLVFSPQDTLWFTLASQCYYVNGSTAQRTSTVILNFSATSTSIVPATSSATVSLPSATLTSEAMALRLCYANANGSYYSVPIDADVVTTVASRQPAQVTYGNAYLHVSQLIVGTFLGPGTPALRGHNGSILPLLAPLPDVDSSGVAFQRTDIAEGSCAFSNPTQHQASQLNATTSRAALVPLRSGTHVACYRLATCVLSDVPHAFRVYEANPSSMRVAPLAPRKGQLLNITFDRVSNESDALMLTPGSDRAFAVNPAVTSCWQLSAGAGWTTSGTAFTAWTQTIFYADPPQLRATVNAVGCYSLVASPSWSTVPQSSFAVLPANPSAFTTVYTPMAYQEIRITFAGESFSALDRAKIIPLSMNCSASSTPPAFISAVGPDASAATSSGTMNGWAIMFVDANTAVLNITSTLEGTFSVCYRLATDSVWTLVYDDLVIQPRNPEIAIYTPVSALESEIFTVSFSRSNRTFSAALEMSASDQLELVGGENANCMVSRNRDLIATGPSRTDLLSNYSFFQMASATRGFFTLCYVRWINGIRVPTWGFPTVTILPNPTSFTTHTSTPLANQYIGIIFVGFGLQSISGRVDQVKLLSATVPKSDLSCRTMNQTVNVDMTAFRAFGNYSIQTVIARTPMEVLVCYKLFGGQYHIMPSTIVFGSQSPSLSLPLKVPLYDGEQQLVNVSYGGNGWRQGDYVYLSSTNCAERPIELLPSPTDVASQFAYSSLLTQDAAGYMIGTVRPLVAGVYALCYRSPQSPISGVTTILQSVVQVSNGVPSALGTALSYVALRIVTIVIPWISSESSTSTYAAVVRQRSQCAGVAAPSQALYADNTTWNATHMTMVGVFPAEGTYYVCTSNTMPPCGVNGRECARIVSTIVVSAAAPQGWTSLPLGSVFYSSDLVRMQFWLGSFASGARIVLQGMTSIAPLNRTTIVNCINASTTRSVQLVEDATSVSYAANVISPGPYSVCAYLPDGSIAVFPNQYLTVQGSSLTAMQLLTAAPTVVSGVVLEATGNGLSTNDSLNLVRLPLRTSYGAALLATTCANATELRVAATATRTEFGATDMDWSLVVPVSSSYVACYRFGHLGNEWTWDTAGGTVVTVAPVVTSVTIAALPSYVNTPIVITLTGLSLASTDRIALVALGSSCSSATAAYVGTSQPTASSIVGSVTVTTTGIYTLCFASTVGVVFEPGTIITVLQRVVVSAQFTITPVCSEGIVCTSQPAVVMLDAGGNAAADRGASISLSLKDAAGNTRDEALTGNFTYALHSTGRFEFFTVGIRAAGTFVMTAFISLLGGQTLVAATSPFVVAQNNTLRTLALSCVPSVVLMRVTSATSGLISCTISATTNFTASVFSIGVSPGTASVPTPSWSTSGYPQYAFDVTVPMQNYSQRFVTIAASTADARYPGRVVDGSPAVVRIGTPPSNVSLLQCSSRLKFNGIAYVRVGETAACSLQGRVVVNHTTYDIIAPSSYFAVSTTLGATVVVVNLPLVPASLNGDYSFVSAEAVNSNQLVVNAYVLEDGGRSPVTGSPQTFVVLRSPTSDSQMTCSSISSGAASFFIPGEGIRCMLLLRDASGAVPTPLVDLLPIIDQGSVQYDNTSGGLVTVVQFTAFAPLGVGGYQLPSLRMFAASSSFQDQLFEIGVVHQPSKAQIATSMGTLVLVTAVVGGNNLVAGYEAALTLSGSGLSLLHTYLVSPFASCDNNASTVAIPLVSVRSSTTAGDLLVSFTTPSYPFYLCFSPNGTNTWQLLLRGAFRNITVVSASSTDGLSSDDIILLVVGCVLLCILLLLLPFVCMRLRTRPPLSNRLAYIPRTNDQFIHRPVVSTPTMDVMTPGGSLSLAPHGGGKEELEFTSVVQHHDDVAASESNKGERKKRKKKIDASIKKIATLQQLELDGKGSQEGSEIVGEEHTPPMPPPLQPHTSRPQEVRIVSVEERHTTQYSTHQYSPSNGRHQDHTFPPLDATNVFPTTQHPAQHQQEIPATMMARPYVVLGHTSMQFASDGPTSNA